MKTQIEEKKLNANITSKYIKFPKTKEEVEESSSLFYAKHGFPQCIGVIDGTAIGKFDRLYKKKGLLYVKLPSCSRPQILFYQCFDQVAR